MNEPVPGRGALRRLLGFAAPLWAWIALSVVLGVATVASGVGLLAASAWIISMAALQPSIAVLEVAIVAVRFFGITRGVFRYLERLVSHNVTFRLLAGFRVWFYAYLEPLAPAALSDYHSGDLLARLTADIGALEHFYVRVLAPPLVALAVAAGIYLFLAAYDLRLAFAQVAFLALAGLGVPVLTRLLSRRTAAGLVTERAALNSALVDGIQGLSDLLAFDQGPAQLARVGALSQAIGRLQCRMAAIRGLHSALGSLLTSLAVLALLVLAIPLVRAARLSGVDLAVLTLAAAASFEAVLPLPLAAQYLESSLEAARRLFALVDTEPPVDGEAQDIRHASLATRQASGATVVPVGLPCLEPSAPCPPCRWQAGQGGRHAGQPALPAGRARPGGVTTGAAGVREPGAARTGQAFGEGEVVPALRVRDLRFAYTPGAPPALDGLTFDVPAGASLAVVGPSGAGKSSLVNVLLRFWEYQAGDIWLFGRDLRAYSSEAARRQVGVVAQNTYLFNASVRDNLLLARPEAGQDEIEAAARAAGIHEFIQALPAGYDTWIGEQGLRLSGGERQRLAIARAVLKDAPLLLLDEATANLDPLTEVAVLHALRTLMQGRTTLLITHRLAGLESADDILVLDEGRVVERGRHAALLARGGLYRRMWEYQVQDATLERLA